jgi:large subunit ribosomal protein L10
VKRTEKENLVASMHKTFEDSSIVVITHYSGLTVTEMSDLRMQMRDVGAGFKVTKNRLARLAINGTKYQPLESMFTGPTAIAYSEDPVAAAKAAVAFSKNNEKLIVLGGALGEEQLDLAAVKALASLPSLETLRAKIAGVISMPAKRIVGVTKAPAGQIARVIGAYSSSSRAA